MQNIERIHTVQSLERQVENMEDHIREVGIFLYVGFIHSFSVRIPRFDFYTSFSPPPPTFFPQNFYSEISTGFTLLVVVATNKWFVYLETT